MSSEYIFNGPVKVETIGNTDEVVKYKKALDEILGLLDTYNHMDIDDISRLESFIRGVLNE